MSSESEYFANAPMEGADEQYFNPDTYAALNQITEELDSYDSYVLNQLQKQLNGVTKVVNTLDNQLQPNLEQSLPLDNNQNQFGEFSFICNKPPPAYAAGWISYVQSSPNSFTWKVLSLQELNIAKSLCAQLVDNDPVIDPPLDENDNENTDDFNCPPNLSFSACMTYFCDELSPGYNPDHPICRILDPDNPTKCPSGYFYNFQTKQCEVIDRRPPPDCPLEKPCPPCPPDTNDKKDCCVVVNKVDCPPPPKIEITNVLPKFPIDIKGCEVKVTDGDIKFSPVINLPPLVVKNEIIVDSIRDKQDEETCIEQAETEEEKEACKTPISKNHLEWFVSSIGQKALQDYVSEFGLPAPPQQGSNGFEVLKGIEAFKKKMLKDLPNFAYIGDY